MRLGNVLVVVVVVCVCVGGGGRARALEKGLTEGGGVRAQNLNEKIAALNAAIDNFSKEAEGGLEKNMNKLSEELNNLESSKQKREASA